MIRVLIFFLVLATVACDDSGEPYSDSILIAAEKCRQSPSEMQWLADVIEESGKDPGLKGNIYAVTVDGKVIFIQQPAIMSCFACILYDCAGNRLAPNAVDLQKVANAMSPSALIYSPY